MRLMVGVVLLGAAILTAQRVTVWRSSLAIWTAADSVTPWQPSSRLFLAVAQWDAGCPTQASQTLARAHQAFQRRVFRPGDQRVTLLWHWTSVFAGFHSSRSDC